MEYTKAQTITCKCGSVIAACVEPYCYTDAKWQRDVRKYAKQGYKINIIDCGDWKMAMCICKDPIDSQLKLF